MMRALVIEEPRRGRIQALDVPECQPGAVRVRVEGCGVCASNLPVWEGRPWFSYPLEPGAPGHEGWGTIEAVGGSVSGLEAGDRVAMLSYHAFAEYDVVAAEAVVKLPASLAGKPFPGEPLGCAVNICQRADLMAGQTVAIVGIGFLGALLTRLAVRAGARVIAIGRRSCALDLARQCGATETIALDDQWAVVERVKALTDGEGCERVIEAVGQQGALDLATELTRERGRLIIAGYHQDGLRQVNMQVWNWRGIDVINAHERDPKLYIQGMRQAVDLVARGELDPSPLYTHTFPLDRFADAVETTLDRPEGFMKALVVTA